MKKLQKGFTLIELLVVIAIIGILSSVVLASLTSARSKGTDAAIQSAMSNMRAQAELYYSANGNSYGPAVTMAACPATSGSASIFATTTTGGLWNLVNDVSTKNGTGAEFCVAVAGSAPAWAMIASTTNGSWCVDSSGRSASSSNITTATATCN